MSEILNDRWHTAVHEAGHAVVGRVLGMLCGPVSIVADDDSAGHSICADPLATLHRWEQCDRYRDASTVFRGRIMTYMAGAEAERALTGSCEYGGDLGDLQEIAMMIACDDTGAPKDGIDAFEERLRRATAGVVRRHILKIDALARALMERDTIADDDEIRAVAGLAPPPPDGAIWLAWSAASADLGDEPVRIHRR